MANGGGNDIPKGCNVQKSIAVRCTGDLIGITCCINFGGASSQGIAMSTRIYTRTGDRGKTALLGGKRVAKDDPRVDSYGEIDELNAILGECAAVAPSSIREKLSGLQSLLFELGAELATETPKATSITEADVLSLEREIDLMEEALAPLKNFILPGGSVLASKLHVARTVCRRAERRCVGLYRDASLIIKYVNRLSDYLFVLARYANHLEGYPETVWKPRRKPT